MAINESTQYYIEKQFAQKDSCAGNFFLARSRAEKKAKLDLMEAKLAEIQGRLKKEVDPKCIKRCDDIIKNLNMSIALLRKNLNVR